MPPDAPAISLISLLPEIILLAAGCIALLLGQAAHEATRRLVPWLTLTSIVAAILTLLFWAIPNSGTGSGLDYGPLAQFVRIAALILGFLLTWVSWSQPGRNERGEFFSMMLFSLTGLMLVGPANDLLMLFLALELVSIPTYVMVVLSRNHPYALEAGTKYFYLGAMAAAVTAFGFSFLYGALGTVSLDGTSDAIALALSQGGLAYGIAAVGLLLSLVGLFFKIAAVPLHFYIADVYQGAASPVAGLLGFVPKLAGFAAIIKILSLVDWHSSGEGLFWLLWIVAAASMTIGNVLALLQTNVKRMLAYSGIAHSGYMLVSFVGLLGRPADGDSISVAGDGVAAVLYYTVIYGIANLGAFAILGLLRTRNNEPCETQRDIAGLLRRHPSLAVLMSIAMLTLMGLPPTAGFWGKLSLFGSALSASQAATSEYSNGLVVLVIIAVLNTAIGAAYYLRIVAACLLYENDEPAEAVPGEAPHMGAVLCGCMLLIFAFYPNWLLGAGRNASSGVPALHRAQRAGPSDPRAHARKTEIKMAADVKVVAEPGRIGEQP